jgi:hypothetical protein
MSVFCAVAGCRTRGLHLAACRDDSCSGCHPRLATEGLICDWHVDRAERDLAEIERLTGDARLVAAGQVRRGHGGAGGKPGSRPPLNVDAVDALDAIQNALMTMAREIADERGLTFGTDGRSGRPIAPWSGENRSGVVPVGIDAQGGPEARTDERSPL